MSSTRRLPAIALALGASLYSALAVAASSQAGPRGWGFHAAGFLPAPIRIALLAGLVACAVWLWIAALATGREDPDAPPDRRRRGGSHLARYALLLPYGALLWMLRARTQLLGDGAVWLATVRSGEHRAYSEPLFAAAWHGFGWLVRRTNRMPTAASMAWFSVLCGVASVPILAGIAREIAPARHRALALALLLTMGLAQLFFGYIESYPFVSLFILLYLWLALRRARGADPGWMAAIALALAVAAHLSALSLLPSYLLLLAFEKKPAGRRLLHLLLPFAAIAAVLLALQYRPAQWAAPLHAAMSGMRQVEGETFHRPYGFFSYAHLADVLNAILLVMPAPALLLLAWAVSPGRSRPEGRALLVMAAAAIPGAALLAGLMTPVSPAQDWDLSAIFLLPSAIFAVAAGVRLAGDLPRRGGAALACLGLLSLLSYTLVNASERASVRRFAAVVDDPARVSPYGRSYGNSVLELYQRDRGNFEAALPYAQAAMRAEPTNPRNWTNVGFELMRLNRHQEAIPYLEEGIRRGPGRWEGPYDLGLCYLELGRNAEAVPAFREAVRLNPDLPVLRHNLGLALYRSGRADSAVVVWRDVLARWPDYAGQLRIPKTSPGP